MPELPEVETVKNGLMPAMIGAKFVSIKLRRSNLRFPFPPNFVKNLQGRTIINLTRRAKYILVHLNDGQVLIINLGMSGRILISNQAIGEFHHAINKYPQHDHVVFELDNGQRIIYNDIRRFGFMDLLQENEIESHKHFANIGLEPLGNSFNAAALTSLFNAKSTPLKSALLDQSLLCGLGNIYVCEALHRSQLSPFRAACTLTPKEAETLSFEIRQVLEEAIVAGGSTLRDYAHADGSLGYFQHSFKVYDQENQPCLHDNCGGVIERKAQSGRSTFFCAQCQI